VSPFVFVTLSCVGKGLAMGRPSRPRSLTNISKKDSEFLKLIQNWKKPQDVIRETSNSLHLFVDVLCFIFSCSYSFIVSFISFLTYFYSKTSLGSVKCFLFLRVLLLFGSHPEANVPDSFCCSLKGKLVMTFLNKIFSH
jgi:hypothetical protein